MARYGKSSYGSHQYGSAPSTNNLLWGLEIDWDDDGQFSGDNEAVRMRGVHVSRGRDSMIAPDGSGFEPQQVGRATIELQNDDYRYDPYNTTSPLYPLVEPGKLARLSVRVGSGGARYNVITGVVQNVIPYDRTTQIVIEDGWSLLNVDTSVTGVYQNTRTDALIGVVLDEANWSAGRDLGGGICTPRYWYGDGSLAIDAVRSLANNEIGFVWVAADGSFKFRNRRYEPASVMTLTQEQLLRNIATPMPWEIRRNVIEASVSAFSVSAGETVYTLDEPLFFYQGVTNTYQVQLDTPAINILQPVKATDWNTNSKADGSGTNRNLYTSLTVSQQGSYATVTVVNPSYEGYLISLTIKGDSIQRGNIKTARATGTGADARPRKLAISLDWTADISEAQNIASGIRDFLGTASILPRVTIEARPDIQFVPDLFDTLTLNIPAKGIDNQRFRVGKIEHETTGMDCQAVRTTLHLEPFVNFASRYWTFPEALGTGTILGW